MRLLFSTLLTTLFFFSSWGSENPVEKNTDKGAAIKSQLCKVDPGYGLLNGHYTTPVKFSGSGKASKQARYYPGFTPGASSAFLLPVASLCSFRQPAPPSPDCTPIALKLLFPKHYFW